MTLAQFLKYTRLTHLFIGVFIAPAILFFAFTGALQTFSLHEASRGSSYKPPAWIVTLGQIHKKQTPVLPVRRPPPSERAQLAEKLYKSDKPAQPQPAADQFAAPAARQHPMEARPADAPPPPPSHNPLPLKIFFLIVAIGLFFSTLTGLYMSYKYVRNKAIIATLLLAGIIIPVLMTIL